MSELIHCYGCGNKVHISAAACPNCGAPARNAAPQAQAQAHPQAGTGIQVSNAVVWILAFAPIIGLLLESMMSGAMHHSERSAMRALAKNEYWYITVALNIGLSFFDEKRLTQSGINTQAFKGMVWLVPVYLFQRAKALGHGKGYFITWLVCFVLSLLTFASLGD